MFAATNKKVRPRRINCYLRWGTPALLGYPQPGSMGGTQGGLPPAGVPPQPGLTGGYPRWSTPRQGYPQLMGGYPRWGTPLAGPGWGTPHLDLAGVPSPHRCGQTENTTFPHLSDAVGNNLQTTDNLLIILSSKTQRWYILSLKQVCE